MIVKIKNKDKEMNVCVKRIILNFPEKGIMRLIVKDDKEIAISTSDFVDIICVDDRVIGD